MSQFAWPFYGIELTEEIQKIWNITENYSEQVMAALYNIGINKEDCGLEVYNPNDEDWYEMYYGVDIESSDTMEQIETKYKDHISKIKEQFQNLSHKIQSDVANANKIYEALDVSNLAEAIEVLNELRDYIIAAKPTFVAIFSF